MKLLILFTLILSLHSIAVPTPTQLAYQEAEIGAIIHFSSNTFGETQGCGPENWARVNSSEVFQPTSLDVDSWLEAAVAFGAKYAVLTAKHQCGFCLWPSNVTVTAMDETNFRYNYSVAFSSWQQGQEDIVRKFMASCKKYKIKPGLYYSVNDNEFLKIAGGSMKNDTKLPGQVSISVQNYRKLMLSQLEELWSHYATDPSNSPLEIWFDGGYPSDVQSDISSLISRILPRTCAFNGYGISANPTRWCGTEDGHTNDPNWSTGESGNGDPDSPIFNPAEVDFTLQLMDQWFYIKNWPVHSVDDLAKVYHNSVGLNANMLLDVAVPPSGKIDAVHMSRFQEFGSFIEKCYKGIPLGMGVDQGTLLSITFTNGTTLIDRVVIRENQKLGQKVRNFTVSVSVGGEWIVVKKGQSIGHKRIVVLDKAVMADEVRVEVDVETKIYGEARLCSNGTEKVELEGFLSEKN